MSWPWIVLLAAALALVVAAEVPRLRDRFGVDARRRRTREKRKAQLRVVSTEETEFVASVQRDLDSLPTVDEPKTPRR
ncbi:MAG TPA: hypothetical protein VJ689_08985 [Gaiellaceae bacterium]|nr:hypothetical protein [Gaiellaceae bacterium]